MNSVNLDSFLIPHHHVEYDGFNHPCIYCNESIKSENYEIIFNEDDFGRPLDVCYAHIHCIEENKIVY